MRILHTADWHLGKRLETFNRLEEQREVLDEICSIAEREKVDVVLVAGDLFDTYNPPVEAVELLYRTLKRLSGNGRRPVIAIAGNHDSADRIESPDPLARECGIIFAGYPSTEIPVFGLESGLQVLRSEAGFVEIKLPRNPVPLRLLLTPYANEQRLKTFLGIGNEDANLNALLKEKWQALADKYCDGKGVNILLAHLFVMERGGEIPEEPDDEKPINIGTAAAIFTENIPRQVQYTALGHLHRAHTVGVENIVYCGSPLSYSFAEAGQQKSVAIIDAEAGQEIKVEKIVLTKGRTLHRKRFENIPDAVEWLAQNPGTLVELTIACDEFLQAGDRKSLLQAHDGIIAIIPEIKGDSPSGFSTSQIDMGMNMNDMFRQYFKSKKSQEPNDTLMDLFKEIMGTQ